MNLIIFVQLLKQVLEDHALPWRIERDWAYEVISEDGTTIAEFQSKSDAEKMIELAKEEWEKSNPEEF